MDAPISTIKNKEKLLKLNLSVVYVLYVTLAIPRLHRAYILVERERETIKINIKKIEKLCSVLDGGKHYMKTAQGEKIRVEMLYSFK